MACVSLWLTFSAMQFQGSPLWRLGMGTTMDSAAFHELVAQIRGTAASLAEAEQKVAAFKLELAQQAHIHDNSALRRAVMPIPKRVSSGWQPAMDKPMTRIT
jgi:hypothetical protein